MEVNLVLDLYNDLGEGPVWNHLHQQLIWVDFDAAKIYTYRPESGECSCIQMPSRVMVAIPTDLGNLVVAMENDIAIVNPTNCSVIKKVSLEIEFPYNRLNDGKCDANGRLWIGTMDNSAKTDAGSLYKVNADLSYERMDAPFTIPNGMAWSKNNESMFLIDSVLHKIYKYSFDLEEGILSNRHTLCDTDPGMGMPDGMCIDSEDNLWIAFWNGKCIACIDSVTGKILQKIETPFVIPSSCCFGGQNLDVLYITSSKKYDSEENIRRYPYSGGLFSLNTGTKGLKSQFFKES